MITHEARSKHKFIWKEGRFSIMVNMDFLFSYSFRTTLSKYWGRREGNKTNILRAAYTCIFGLIIASSKNHTLTKRTGWRKSFNEDEKKKSQTDEKTYILHWQKAPEDYWLILPLSELFLGAGLQLLSIFHEIRYVASCFR